MVGDLMVRWKSSRLVILSASLFMVGAFSLSKFFHGFAGCLVLCTPVHGTGFSYAVLRVGGRNCFEG